MIFLWDGYAERMNKGGHQKKRPVVKPFMGDEYDSQDAAETYLNRMDEGWDAPPVIYFFAVVEEGDWADIIQNVEV